MVPGSIAYHAVVQPLVDGLWLEWCIDPKQISERDAKEACYRLLEPFFGKIKVKS